MFSIYKPTHNFSFLHFHSNHPRHIKPALPYTIFNRINNIVSHLDTNIDRKLFILDKFIQLKYPFPLLYDAFLKSFKHNSSKKQDNNNTNLNYIVPYNQYALSFDMNYIKPFINYLKSIRTFNTFSFNKSFILRPNLFYSLISSDKPHNVSKCNKIRCKTCPLLICYNNKHTFNNVNITINQNVNCTSKCVIYILFCSCGKSYVGKTISEFHLRINLHRQHILSDLYTIQYVSKHIKSCSKNFTCSILYKVHDDNVCYIEDIENYFIYILNPELNRFTTL